MKKIIFILSALVLVCASATAQSHVKFSHNGIRDSAIVYLPRDYTVSEKYPVLILEVGKTDTANVFIPPWLRDKKYIIISPTRNNTWNGSKQFNDILKYFMDNYAVDTTAMFIRNY